MINRRFTTTREFSLAASLTLNVLGPSLALAQDHRAPTAMSHELRRTGDARANANGQPPDPGADMWTPLWSELNQGPVRTLRK